MPKDLPHEAAGPRVRLRPLAEADLPLTLRWRNHDDVRVWFRNSDPLTWDQHRGWFERYLAKDDEYQFVIEVGDRPVGQVGLYRLDRAAGTAEYGRLMVGEPDAAGRGVAAAATGLLLALAFDRWGLCEVRLEVLAHNARAMRLYDRTGFVRTGEGDGMVYMLVTPDTFRRPG